MIASLTNYFDAQLNPIMVKEIYQGFRSRSFLTGLFLALLIPLGAYMVIVLGTDADTSRDDLGAVLFGFISMSMIVASVFIIPSSAGGQLRNEITSSALDLITITQLTPWKIISGHFQAAVLHLLLLFAYAGPFALAAFLLGGIGAMTIMLFLLLLFFYSLTVCSIMLMLNALPALHPANNRVAQAARVILLFLVLFSVAIIGSVDSARLLSSGSTYAGDLLWQLLNIVLLLFVGALLCLRMAADMLITASIRSFFYSKLFLIVWLAVVSGSLLVIESTGRGFSDRDVLEFQAALCLLVLFTFATFWSGFYSKTLTSLKRSWGYYLLGDSYMPTVLYTALCSISLAIIFALLGIHNWAVANLAVFCVFVFYTGLARLIVAFLPASKRNARYYYSMLVVLVTVQSMVGSLFIGEVDIYASEPSLLVLTTPIVWFQAWSVLQTVAPSMWLLLFIGLFAASLSKSRQRKRKSHDFNHSLDKGVS